MPFKRPVSTCRRPFALLDHPPEGEGPGELQFKWASELMESSDYWARALRCSKGATLAMVRKTFTIMGRDEASSDHDLSKFYYPAMQAADIFEMDIDIAIGGMDQRKAHMFMRDVASKYGWAKATCLHTPIISSLKASGSRMESFDHKMSKSDPNGALLLHDTHDQIRKKMRKAYISPEDPQSPVYELAEHILLPEFGEIVVTPTPNSANQARGRTWRRFGQPSWTVRSTRSMLSLAWLTVLPKGWRRWHPTLKRNPRHWTRSRP